MRDPCPSLEVLVDLDRLPADSPLRTHVGRCPQCRSSLAAYRSFLDPPDLGSEARLEDANRKLSRFLSEAIGDPHPPSPTRPEEGPGWTEVVRRAVGRLRSSPWRGLVPAGALVVALALVFRFEGSEPEMRLRDGTDPTGLEASIQSTGREGITLSWTTDEPDLDYEVILYTPEFREHLRLEVGEAEFAAIPWEEILVPGKGDLLLFQVVGSRSGDEIVKSPLQPLPAREE